MRQFWISDSYPRHKSDVFKRLTVYFCQNKPAVLDPLDLYKLRLLMLKSSLLTFQEWITFMGYRVVFLQWVEMWWWCFETMVKKACPAGGIFAYLTVLKPLCASVIMWHTAVGFLWYILFWEKIRHHSHYNISRRERAYIWWKTQANVMMYAACIIRMFIFNEASTKV